MANTAIFLAEGFEEIEGLMVVDMLRRAGVNVDMVSISDSLQVNGRHAIPVIADKLIKEIDFPPELIVNKDLNTLREHLNNRGNGKKCRFS